MNRYTVVYLTEAEDNLIAIWADATDRDQVTESADAADRLLAENPLHDAVYLSEQLWRRNIPPLRYCFISRFVSRTALLRHVK